MIRMDIKNKIEIVQGEIAKLGLSERQPRNLYMPIEYIMALGGKRLRPLMLLLAYEAYKPTGSIEEVAPAMRAIELFHNFTLLHDDIMDDAPLRRGKPTVYKKWGANTAILSGDAMLTEAYRHLAELSPDKLPTALHLFNDMATAVFEGQEYDMDYELRGLDDMTIEEYVGMIRLKTSYLFCGAVSLGTYLGDAPQKDRELLWKAVELMGLAFQIKDDYLDIYGDPGFGKRRGGDILEGKRTWLLLSAYALDRDGVKRAFATTDEEERIDAVTDLYTQLGIKEAALDEVQRLSDEASAILNLLTVDANDLRELFHSLVKREV